MKICESWLREWVNPSLSTEDIGAQLTMLGLEIDSLHPVAGNFTKIIVAKVLNTKSHPKADKLSLCEVDDGNNVFQVVCGAANVRPGLKVALATIGATLPDGMIIKKTLLRDEESNGMLCSASELGLEEKSEGILELPDDAPIGVDISEYLLLKDFVFDIDLTPNRADCFSVLGVARDLAARNKLALKAIPDEKAAISIDVQMKVNIHEPKACSQYFGRIIKGINENALTPIWMKERLRRSGIRSSHPIVDIMNYVMLEVGQPMHAFDLSTIVDNINVRFAKNNEELVLLNGQQVELSEDVLVIADANNPIAIAGVMGGEDSSVKENTRDIFLESAFFNPVVLANIARKFGLSSDASQRYERGVDHKLQLLAIERATSLILDIVGGKAGPITNASQLSEDDVKIKFSPEKVEKLTGVNISFVEMEEILRLLGMQVSKAYEVWEVVVPSYRFDINIEVDLVEEIIRLYGFDQIPRDVLKISMQTGKINSEERVLLKARNFLANRGYHETISYSFVDPNLQQMLYPDINTLKLLNPISAELSEMRVGMWSGLLASMMHNMHRQQSGMKLFEAGVAFQIVDAKLTEKPYLAGLIYGMHGSLNWSESSSKYDFYDMKGDLEALFAVMNHKNYQFVPTEYESLHPGKSAKIMFGQKQVGLIGVLHPKFMDALDFNDEVILFELELNDLENSEPTIFKSISKYPQTRRDLSLLVDENINAMQIEKSVMEVVDTSYLKAFDIFDVYVGDSIPKNKKSLAISLTLQNDSRTLVDVEINDIMDNILKKLTNDFAVELRSCLDF